MKHPYSEYESSPLWKALDAEIAALEKNGDLKLTSARPYVLGSIAKTLVVKGLVAGRLGCATDGPAPDTWQCAFCGEVVDNIAAIHLTLDVQEGGQQELQSHRTCLVKALHRSVPLA
jgi:hypothetical protein